MKSEEGNWREFEQWVEKLRTDLGQEASPLIFRGQGDFEWPLETTLERNGHKNMSFANYYMLITEIGPAISALTAEQTPRYNPNLEKGFSGAASFREPGQFPSGPEYEYMAYLRHHGFPSPLLDWSRSPYVAAFFVFRNAKPEDKKRSIFAYCEWPTRDKSVSPGFRRIRALGPYVRTHRRHFLQQSVYTVCESLDANDNWQYDSHQKVFENADREQAYLRKFDIPSVERVKVLRLLGEFNLNSYSLFGSEESLLETLWIREQVNA